jgi:hypothetical protein
MKFNVSVHSVIDLITNSSTEMFIDYSGSIDHIKELVNEILVMQGSSLTCDDIFHLKIVSQYADEDYEGNLNEDPTELEFIVKDPAYEKLAKLIKTVLDSGDLNEYMC